MSNGKSIGRINTMTEATAVAIARVMVMMTVNLDLTQPPLLTLAVEIAEIGAHQNQQNGMNQNLNLIQTSTQVQDRILIAEIAAIGAHRNQQNGMSQRRRKLQNR